MDKEKVELEKRIKKLEDELMASMRREEILTGGGGDSLKQKIKRTKLGRAATNPNTLTGKILRSPRTAYRIITHPKVLKDIVGKDTSAPNVNSEDKKMAKKDKALEDLYVPVEFIKVNSKQRRLNLVTGTIDESLLKEAIDFANDNDYELRVVTYKQEAASNIYRVLVKKKKIHKANEISFYSSVDQSKKKKVFKLEIGEGDIFLTLPWTKK